MFNGVFHVPQPVSEPVLNYAPGSPERTQLKQTLDQMRGTQVEVPLIIGGQEVRSGETAKMVCPHDRGQVLGVYHQGEAAHVHRAIDAANAAKAEWSTMPWDSRAIVLLKAAALLAGKYRQVLNAATMLNMSKTAHQAEIDSACELIDFWRFNPHFMRMVYEDQPLSTPQAQNYMEHRPLEGFVLALSPFNFTSIAGNLPTAPALMGNTVVWKPASSAVLPAYYIMKVLEEAGMPPGVINLVPGPGPVIAPPALNHLDLGGIHFTGSTYVFSTIWLAVGSDIRKYFSYPRIVGETGGKDFIFAHASADLAALTAGIVRGAFEYQGQKCSACSRVYVPDSRWPELRERLLGEIGQIRMGDVCDFRNFMGAVIDGQAFASIAAYLDYARQSPDLEILSGGGAEDRRGYFIEPTLVLSRDPRSKLMCEEIFGPVLTVYVYKEQEYGAALELCNRTSPYALTGAIFAQDRRAIVQAMNTLRHAAGNFYVNDKPTGAVVGQQPFGGARASGTNDKAGSWLNLERWVSPRTIKETFLPPQDFRYPYMAAE
ncbi:MAG: L-glutamate gamma-semialdehyde dehydrogenase [Verrucomicrobia bacterium]|nr:L-glutamate gamma-semialdehyde dehydrogenase [Verrucomicrobiota bacterium]